LEENSNKEGKNRNSGGWYDIEDSGEYYMTYYHTPGELKKYNERVLLEEGGITYTGLALSYKFNKPEVYTQSSGVVEGN
jgi:hypothetical protein